MKATTIAREVKKLGGVYIMATNERGQKKVQGLLNGWDIVCTDDDSYFLARRVTQRGSYDAGSDYNPMGWAFNYKVKYINDYKAV